MNKNLVSCGIYSFPKSGNTWMRSIISSLLLNGEFNAIPDVHQKFDPSDICYYKYKDDTYMFFKSHTNYLVDYKKLFKAGRHLPIYIYRHPLDVFLSQLNFMLKVDVKSNFQTKYHGVDHIYRNGVIRVYLDAFILYGTLNCKFEQSGSWFENISFWRKIIDNKDSDSFYIRYEDMQYDLGKALFPLLKYFGKNKKLLNEAIKIADNKTKKDGRFFWKKRSSNYINYLSPEDILWFYKFHGSICNEIGFTLEDTLKMYAE